MMNDFRGQENILIFATGLNGEFSRDGKLPWVKCKTDLDFFKKITMGNNVVMGINTFASLNYKPLKNRTNIVACSLTHENYTDIVNKVKRTAGICGPDDISRHYYKYHMIDHDTELFLIDRRYMDPVNECSCVFSKTYMRDMIYKSSIKYQTDPKRYMELLYRFYYIGGLQLFDSLFKSAFVTEIYHTIFKDQFEGCECMDLTKIDDLIKRCQLKEISSDAMYDDRTTYELEFKHYGSEMPSYCIY